jgi:exopolysaccharide biosynthesis protein
VDGRQPRWSVGVPLPKFAAIFRKLGAVAALNLDGGGSSTMVVKGEVVNRPSEGHERRISNVVLVLPGPDPGES